MPEGEATELCSQQKAAEKEISPSALASPETCCSVVLLCVNVCMCGVWKGQRNVPVPWKWQFTFCTLPGPFLGAVLIALKVSAAAKEVTHAHVKEIEKREHQQQKERMREPYLRRRLSSHPTRAQPVQTLPRSTSWVLLPWLAQPQPGGGGGLVVLCC